MGKGHQRSVQGGRWRGGRGTEGTEGLRGLAPAFPRSAPRAAPPARGRWGWGRAPLSASQGARSYSPHSHVLREPQSSDAFATG